MTILFLLRHGFLELLKMGLTFYVKAKKIMAGVINVSLLLQLTKGKNCLLFYYLYYFDFYDDECHSIYKDIVLICDFYKKLMFDFCHLHHPT